MSIRFVYQPAFAASLILVSLCILSCSGGGEARILDVGDYTIARIDFFRPGEYKVEAAHDEYGCEIWVLSKENPVGRDGVSDMAYISESLKTGLPEGADPSILIIRDGDRFIEVRNAGCKVTRTSD